jgi:hypothetical protein
LGRQRARALNPQAGRLIVTQGALLRPKKAASSVMQPYSQHNREQAQHIVGSEIQSKCAKFTLMPVRHIFISKRREGGKRAAETCGHQQSPAIMLVVGAPGKNIPDNYAAQDVYRQSSVWKSVMIGNAGRKTGDEETAKCPKDCTHSHP